MDSGKKRRITGEDLYRFQLVASPSISPDGRHVVFSLDRMDRKAEKKYANLWIVPTHKGTPRQFTHGDQRDSQPTWSPDGNEIAVLGQRLGRRAEVAAPNLHSPVTSERQAVAPAGGDGHEVVAGRDAALTERVTSPGNEGSVLPQ